ncbi:MAG: exonuclease domain-containing protein [Clostridium sp.]|uniref:exonuclease domain-containing protein n=1 Tax=Clostridium sp. TaxID=1506 RepID=UPI002FCB9A78
MLFDFITIDFEIANNNYDSACSVGIVGVRDLKIVDEFYSLIKPPTMEFSKENMEINHITPADIIDSPSFPEVWENIKQYFSGNIIIAHNASFDMSVLKNCLKRYNISIPNFTYICSIPISTKACRGQNIGRSLESRCKHFDIDIINHHNALDDSKSCASLVLASISKTNRKSFESFCRTYASLPFKNFIDLEERTTFPNKTKGKSKFNNVNISEVVATVENIDSSHEFYNKNIVFTGNLKAISRKDAMSAVVNLGGILKSTVSKKTDYLIVGKQDESIVGYKGRSTKEIKASQLIKEGCNINILKENHFLEALKK